MKYQEAMDYIEKCAQYGIVPGLDCVQELCKRLGNPQKDLKIIHIAGTNGKGSTLAFISTVLTENGWKVGRYISPTIFEYRERFQIGGRPISKAQVAKLMEEVAIHADAMQQEGLPHPTPFEIETVMAFLLFAKKQCDFVVLETGMGGAMDATNVVTNTLISVITSVGRDHMGFLGDTLEEIAVQKAGIMKPGCVVVSAPQAEEVENVLREEAQKKQVKEILFVNEDSLLKCKYGIEKQSFYYQGFGKVELSLLGSYQLMNAALALQVILCLQDLGYPMKEDKIRSGIKKTCWPGRFQIIDKKPFFIVDGAHNEPAARELRKSIEFYFTNRPIIYIMGMFKDKEYEKVVELTSDLATHIITVSAKGTKRALPSLDLAKEIAKVHSSVTAADSIEEAVEISYLLADADTVIIAFGSLSYLGDCIQAVELKKKMRRSTHDR